MTVTVKQKGYRIILTICCMLFFLLLSGACIKLILEITNETSVGYILGTFISTLLLSILPLRILAKDLKAYFYHYTFSADAIVRMSNIKAETKKISRSDVIGFSLADSYSHFLFWTQKFIYIYLSNGEKIVFKSWGISNYWELRNFLLKNYNFLGSELYSLNFLGDNIFHFESKTIKDNKQK